MRLLSELGSLRAGDSINLQCDLPSFPASQGWTAAYVIVSPVAHFSFSPIAGPDGNSFVFNVPSVTTAAWGSGVYAIQGTVTNGTQRHTFDTGMITVTPDFATLPGGLDTRSHVKRVLDAIEAVIERRATEKDRSTTVGDRTLSKLDPMELIKVRDKYWSLYQLELDRIRVENGGRSHSRIRAVFVDPNYITDYYRR